MMINTQDATTRETLALIAKGDNDAIGARLVGLTRIVREFGRLNLVAPANLIGCVEALTEALVCDECNTRACHC